jgi:hypothetical protein
VGSTTEVSSHPDVVQVTKLQTLTDRYPHSYNEMVECVQAVLPTARKSVIQKIVKEDELKDNSTFSAYNFRTNTQRAEWLRTGILPKVTPSIFSHEACIFIAARLAANQT